MEIDTGSGAIWVNCKVRGPMVVGRNGLFNPRTDSFLKVIISFLGRTFYGHNAWSLVSRHTVKNVHLVQEPESRRIGAFAAAGVQLCFNTSSILTS
ncbi:hypothetical protein KC19_9G094000 [Ceratodon purpureus]|uniref:Uncharacterized protein n=1 Tax=Ceratodon purpureus TaxID=3225 RepID=A0A8T0GTX7_CERPU|nr:hypothetical protein KC19_9G094000 [Ceratodon purpureus]